MVEHFGLSLIATGDTLRSHVSDGTELGKEARSYMDAGDLVPDDLVLRMVAASLREARDGFVLEGFPRNVWQARALEKELDACGRPLSAVIGLMLDDELAVKRLAGRRTCQSCQRTYNVELDRPRVEGVCDACGGRLMQRADDDELTVQRRLEVYHQQTAPVLDFYSGRRLLRCVDADGPEQEVTRRCLEALRDLTPG